MQSTISLTSQQQEAVELITQFATGKRPTSKAQTFRVAGPAGTGKTTVIAQSIASIRHANSSLRIAVVAPTGKAAQVLQRKGIPARTIHSTLYEQISSSPLRFAKKLTVPFDVIIADESSMISKDIFRDMTGYPVNIVFVGDPYQLEPIGDDPRILTGINDVTLTEIHRQAEENPIITFATWLRENPSKPTSHFFSGRLELSSAALIRKFLRPREVATWLSAYDQIIVGRNTTRCLINTLAKQSPTLLPIPGERLICLKNNYTYGITNGQQFTVGPQHIVTGTEDTSYNDTLHCIDDEGDDYHLPFFTHSFNNPTFRNTELPRDLVALDYAYAITCHKSQGSEWDRVAVIDEAFGDSPNRWRYTAATRAAVSLTWS
jgi:exodeoxyribonuclease-5